MERRSAPVIPSKVKGSVQKVAAAVPSGGVFLE
jgi:hypothetical protein